MLFNLILSNHDLNMITPISLFFRVLNRNSLEPVSTKYTPAPLDVNGVAPNSLSAGIESMIPVFDCCEEII